jgi:putative flippase GtrA
MGRIKRELWLFSKAQASAMVATLVDFSLSFVLAEAAGIYYVAASFLGALTGGIVNCATNYRWVFRPQGAKKRYVASKYLIVWCGSIALNTAGTYVLTELSQQYFMLAKAAVAVVVAVLWNYQLQRRWVYTGNERNKK